ncbi:hypothetical protein ACP8HI_25645 [Paenibacillus sp. FA6]|uniref:hypothetical protein n=1 Tax=Paenibacillus sp. FA6 TaxID=3413029 RepID=UPI003F65EBA3
MAENVSYAISVSRDLSLNGIQTISGIPFKPKSFIGFAFVSNTNIACDGFYAENGLQRARYRSAAGTYLNSVNFITIETSTGILAFGTIQNVVDGSFGINWAKTGLPNGTVSMYLLIEGH